MNNQLENRPNALLFALTCVVSWAFIPVVSRYGQSTLDNYQFLFWSSMLSFVVLAVYTLISGKSKYFLKYTLRDLGIASILGLMGSYVYYLFLYYAYKHTQGLEVLALQYTWPIFIVGFSAVFLKERITKRTLLATSLGFLGVLIIITKGSFHQIYLGNIYIDLLVLLAAAVFGLFSVISKKVNYEPLTATTIFFLSATICSIVGMFEFSKFAYPSSDSFFPLMLNGVLINGLSYVLWLKALSYAEASFVAQLVFLTPVIASILVVLFFGEIFSPIYVLSMGLVIAAGLIAQGKQNN